MTDAQLILWCLVGLVLLGLAIGFLDIKDDWRGNGRVQ